MRVNFCRAAVTFVSSLKFTLTHFTWLEARGRYSRGSLSRLYLKRVPTATELHVSDGGVSTPLSLASCQPNPPLLTFQAEEA